MVCVASEGVLVDAQEGFFLDGLVASLAGICFEGGDDTLVCVASEGVLVDAQEGSGLSSWKVCHWLYYLVFVSVSQLTWF